MGEVMLRGKTVMKGYLRGPTATEKVFRGGWFRSGDLAVGQPDGYIEIKDRKEIIISGGENPRSRSRRCSTGTRRSWRGPWSRSRAPPGARLPARSSP